MGSRNICPKADKNSEPEPNDPVAHKHSQDDGSQSEALEQHNTNLPQQDIKNLDSPDKKNGHCSQSTVNTSDSNTETKTKPTQIMTDEPSPDTPLQTTDGSNNNQSKPDDETSFPEAKTKSESDIRPQQRPEAEIIMNKQPEENNHSPPGEKTASEEHNTNLPQQDMKHSDSPDKKNGHCSQSTVNTSDCNTETKTKPTQIMTDEPSPDTPLQTTDGSNNNQSKPDDETSFPEAKTKSESDIRPQQRPEAEIIMNKQPEENNHSPPGEKTASEEHNTNLPQQDMKHSDSPDKKNGHCSQSTVNTSDCNTETKTKPTQIMTDEPSPDTPLQTTDGSNNNQSKPDDETSFPEAKTKSESDIRPQQRPEAEIIMNKQPEENNHSPPGEKTGYTGLTNQGATCYLNAVLQTLFMTEDFRKAIMELNEKKGKKNTVSLELKKIFQSLEFRKGSVSTNGVTKALAIKNVSAEQDAAEYFQIILSKIEAKSAKIFQGKKKHTTTCLHSQHEYTEEIPYFSLTIAMDSDQHEKTNVQNSFNAQFKEIRMDGEDQLYCKKCKNKRDMQMSCCILELPEVLTLHLQRFYLDYNSMTYMKNNRHVEIPLQLRVQENNGGCHMYDLYAVVNHTGSLSSGHYYADIKSFVDQKWYQFNDSMVNRIGNDYDVGHYISGEACLLFFRKSSEQQNTNLPQQDMKHSDSPDKKNGHCSQSTVNTSDCNTETKTKPTQIMTDEPSPDTPLQTTDGSNNNQSKPDDETSFPEAKTKSESDIRPQQRPEAEIIMNKQPEENNHSPPGEKTASEQNNTNLPQQDMKHSDSPDKKNGHCSQSTVNTSDCNTETKTKPTQIMTDEPSPDTPLQTTDGSNNNQSKPDDETSFPEAKTKSESDIRPQQRPEAEIIMNKQPEENNHSPPGEKTASEQHNTNLPQQDMKHSDSPDKKNGHCSQSTVNTSDSNTETKTKPTQIMTDEPSPDTPLQTTDGSNNNQSKPDDETFSEQNKENNESQMIERL